MLRTVCKSDLVPETDNGIAKKRTKPSSYKRSQSASPVAPRPCDLETRVRNITKSRRCTSLSPSAEYRSNPQENTSMQPTMDVSTTQSRNYLSQEPETEFVIPHCVVTKTMRMLATKRREFMKLRKNLIMQQDSALEHYATVKELESRVGIEDGSLEEMRILSLKGWPAHDLLLLLRDDLDTRMNNDVSGVIGPQMMQQLQAQLNPIPEEVLSLGAEMMARRLELLNLLRYKHRNDRATYATNLEWKTKNQEFDNETEQLHRLVARTAENLRTKINFSLDVAKIPWIDRDTLVKKIERLAKENVILQHKIEDFVKKEYRDNKDSNRRVDAIPSYQAILEELSKERAARESLKEVVTGAESMLRAARSRIGTLERQLKDSRAELEAAHRKHKDLEQLFRNRETSFDARSRKLLAVSKTGELTIEALSRQRDALETRVKELREIAENAERAEESQQAELKARTEMLQENVAEQERINKAAEVQVLELKGRVKELEGQLQSLRERSVRLVDSERRRCFEYLPSKESEPSDRETEIWKELQVTRVGLSKAEEELRQCRADKESFLESLSKIAQGDGSDKNDKMGAELVKREQQIQKLQNIIGEQRENEKIMEHSMTEYENQLASLRLEVKRLRNYECNSKDNSYQDLHTELLELQMQVDSLTRERSALVSVAASRALMLERHERAADLFAKTTRARLDLEAYLDGDIEPPRSSHSLHTEVSRSLTSVCASAAETWSALKAERARVLRLESTVVTQSMQLERETRIRTQLERRRATLEREILRKHHAVSSNQISTAPSLIPAFFSTRCLVEFKET